MNLCMYVYFKLNCFILYFLEIDELRLHLRGFDIFQFSPSQTFFDNFGDGGVAIVDQIVCSHSRYHDALTKSIKLFGIIFSQ